MFIIVCYTDVRQSYDVEVVTPALNAMTGVLQWTIDLTDCDKVLRVVALTDITAQVRMTLHAYGYACNVMPC